MNIAYTYTVFSGLEVFYHLFTLC